MQIARKPFEPESVRNAERGWQSSEKAPGAAGEGDSVGGGLSGPVGLGGLERFAKLWAALRGRADPPSAALDRFS